MPGLVLHSGAIVKCFHQIPALIAPTPRVWVSAFPVATVPPTGPLLPVAPGCPFQVPVPGGTKPQPCATIRWDNISTRVQVMGMPVFLQAAPSGAGNGICQSAELIQQGVPTVNSVQPRVTAT